MCYHITMKYSPFSKNIILITVKSKHCLKNTIFKNINVKIFRYTNEINLPSKMIRNQTLIARVCFIVKKKTLSIIRKGFQCKKPCCSTMYLKTYVIITLDRDFFIIYPFSSKYYISIK